MEVIVLKEGNRLNLVKSGNFLLDIKNPDSFEIFIGEELTVNLTNILENINKSVNLKIHVLENSNLIFNNIDIISMVEVSVEVYLNKGADAIFNNVILSKDTTHLYDIKVINCGDKSKGRILQKAVVKDGGVVRFLSTGKISKEASYCENFQENRILLIDGAAKGEASPFLFIDNNDVKAGHKAVVSVVDEESLYYLQTRGISNELGKNLLTLAFVNSILNDMGVGEDIRELIDRNLDV